MKQLDEDGTMFYEYVEAEKYIGDKLVAVEGT